MAERVRVNAFALADLYLKQLGWPSTPTTRRVLAAWFMRESARVSGSKTDIWVVGNNPLNISCRSCSNYRLAGGGSIKIKVYDTPQAGIQDFGRLINGGGPGYSGIVKAFNNSPNDAGPIILAIVKSGWVTGGTNSYIHNGKNVLAATYNQLGQSDVNNILPPSYNVPTTSNVGAFGNLISYPEGHVITSQDIQDMSATLDKNHFFANPIQRIAFEEFMKQNALGQPWSKALEDKLAKQAGIDAGNVANATNVSGLTINLFGSLAGKAAAIAAILIGMGLALYGAWLMTKDIYSGSGSEGLVNPTPIFVRE